MSLYEGPLLWGDLEATHLEPTDIGASILEIAFAVTEGPELEVTAKASMVIRPPGNLTDHDRVWAGLDPKVRDMHTANGLWVEATTSQDAWQIHDANVAVAQWLAAQADRCGFAGKWSLCGSGVERYDRPWIKYFLPYVFGQLTYFSVWDLGTHRRALQYSGRVDLIDIVKDVDNKPHRAMDDVLLHIEEARRYADLYRSIDPEAHG